MRVTALMAALTTVACATEFSKTGRDADADAGEDTAVDTATEALPDIDVPDGEPDAPVDPPYEPIADSGADPLVDPGLDTPACPSLTSSLGGVCNIVEQCGCAYGEYCEYSVDTTSCIAWEVCQHGTRGTLGIGDACDPTADRCSPGHICVADTSGTYICWRWCETDEHCPSGRVCGLSPTIEPCTTSPFMHGVCWPAPD